MNRDKCYGQMFPTVNAPRSGVPIKGKVFSIELTRAGGMAIATRSTAVGLEAWEECLACDAFDSCYKLSMAKLALETGVMQN